MIPSSGSFHMKESSIDSQKIIRRKRDGELEYLPDDLTIEEPLELRIGRKTLATTMRTPGHDEELAAGFFDVKGELKVAPEDIGRHNAVDKSIGRAFLDGRLPLYEHLLFVSGRASLEIIQKALAAGIPIIAAVSAPSTLAVSFARQGNQTLIGFLRPPSFNIYAHVERVILT